MANENDYKSEAIKFHNRNLSIKKYHKYVIEWLRDWFETNGKGCNAVIGISGGKDSTVVAALCTEALGADRVVGVLMPNGVQKDISDSHEVCDFLGIKKVIINIEDAYNCISKQVGEGLGTEVSSNTTINLPPRLRMSTLYAVAQSCNGRVIGTSNRSEWLAGYFTRWGDGVSDCEPIIKLTVGEVIDLGLDLGLPEHLVKKTPSDGLCGQTDEDKLGFTYAEFEDWLYNGETDKKLNDKYEKMKSMVKNSAFKRNAIPEPEKFFGDDSL